MLALSKDFRRNAAGALSALTVFSAATPAAGCGLVDNDYEWAGMGGKLYAQVGKTVPAPLAGGVAGGLMIKLKDALKNASNKKMEMVQFPDEVDLGRPVTEGEATGYAIAPYASLGSFNIFTCFEAPNPRTKKVEAYSFAIAGDGSVSRFTNQALANDSCEDVLNYAASYYNQAYKAHRAEIAAGACISPSGAARVGTRPTSAPAGMPPVPGPQASPN